MAEVLRFAAMQGDVENSLCKSLCTMDHFIGCFHETTTLKPVAVPPKLAT